jgi:adenine-specific DNA-methyltransferase
VRRAGDVAGVVYGRLVTTAAAAAPAGPRADPAAALLRTAQFPRLRYMGSKYRLTTALADVLTELGGATALDAFSGSGVVSYLMKALGYDVTSNDFLSFPSVIARATVTNQDCVLSDEDIDRICSPAVDDRDFIRRTFEGLYFPAADLRFLDTAWSHIDLLNGSKRALAISALILAAAKKQPRGVFTVTDMRYDDGRRDLRISMEQQFRECARAYGRVVFRAGVEHQAVCSDVFALPRRPWDVVYLDPPYAPASDDNCYIKRYHFLEGLSVYWEGRRIMAQTKTKKLEKRFTPFSYKRTIADALDRTLDRFTGSALVLSYSSNAVPDLDTVRGLMLGHRRSVEVRSFEHRYSFGTHVAARRRQTRELLFIGT